MIEKISLRMFWVMMLCCASFAVLTIWREGDIPVFIGKLIDTTLIIGIASFLVWAPHLVYRFYASMSRIKV